MKQQSISAGGRQFNVLTGQYDRFWNRVNRGQWEPSTYAFFEENIDENTLLIDFGAWVGSTAFFGVQSAARCVAFEPDLRAFEELEANLALNHDAQWFGNIEVFNEAIHESGAALQLHSGSETGGDSMSSALSVTRPHSVTVESRRLQSVVEEFRGDANRVFVKMDIEGGEYSLLPSITEFLMDHDFVFLIEFHHRQLLRSFKLNTDENSDWKQDYQKALAATLEALPFERQFQRKPGVTMTRNEIEAMVLGKTDEDSLLIC